MDAMSRLVKFDKQSIDRAAMALAKMFHCEERLVDEEDIFSYKRSNGIWVVGDVIAIGDRLSEQDEFWCSFNFTDMVRKVIRALEEDDEQETAKAGDEDASNAEAEVGDGDCSSGADSASADDCDTMDGSDIRDSVGDMVSRSVEDAQKQSSIDIEAEQLYGLIKFAQDSHEEYDWLASKGLLDKDSLSIKLKADLIYVMEQDKMWKVQDICKQGKDIVVHLLGTSYELFTMYSVPLEFIDKSNIIAFNRDRVPDVLDAIALDGTPAWQFDFDGETSVSVFGFGASYECKSLNEAYCRLVDLYTSPKTSEFANQKAVDMMMDVRMSAFELDVMLAAIARHGLEYSMEFGLKVIGAEQ